EDLLALGLGDAGAAVADAELEAAILRAALEADAAARGRVADRVLEQVADEADEVVGAADDAGAGAVPVDGDALGVALVADEADRLAADLDEVDRLGGDVVDGAHAGDGEQVLGEPAQARGALERLADGPLVLAGVA